MRWIFGLLALLAFAGCETDYVAPTPQPDMGEDMEEDVAPDVFDLRSISPTQGNVDGGTVVTLTGSAFATGMTVKFGELDATNVVIESATRARATTPAAQAGMVDVSVTLGEESDTLQNAFTYVAEPDPAVGFCRLQAQSPAFTNVGEPTDILYAIVFSEGITPGEGQGAGIEGELGWGNGAEVSNYAFTTMAYNVDVDGLSAGDRSNDEYGAALTVPTSGEFKYVARFRTTSSNTWTYCDLDGSDNGIQEDQLGVLVVNTPVTPQIGYCQLQAQSPAAATTGDASPTLYAFVYAEGLTPGAGQASGIQGELGWAAPGTVPESFNWKSMTYNVDIDGAVPGDRANDEYGTSLTISNAGTYDYLARFKLADGEWVYCDLDGNTNGTDAPGVITVTDPPQPEVGFCQTHPGSLTVETGSATAAIDGVVFVAGATSGAGQGAGVQAQLVWGPASSAPGTWSNIVTPTFAGDEDGLVQGDLANDRYTATITPTAAGTYGYAYRFSANGGTTWTYCDRLGGSPFSPSEVGEMLVQDVIINLPESCKLQFPELDVNVEVGSAVTIYGRVTEPGLTGGGTANAQVVGELLVGPTGQNPQTNPGAFTVIPATVRNTGVINPAPNQDEYEATWTAGPLGSYTFAYRFSVDGGQNFAYCDLNGTDANSGFSTNYMGLAKTWNPANPPYYVDYCHVWQSNISADLSQNAPVVTVETYKAGLTDLQSFDGTEINAEVGYGPLGANPAIAGAFTWQNMSYKGPRPGVENNKEYEGGAYDNAAKPLPGTYSVAVRVRKAPADGTEMERWVYCDTNNATMTFFTGSMTTLTVTP